MTLHFVRPDIFNSMPSIDFVVVVHLLELSLKRDYEIRAVHQESIVCSRNMLQVPRNMHNSNTIPSLRSSALLQVFRHSFSTRMTPVQHVMPCLVFQGWSIPRVGTVTHISPRTKRLHVAVGTSHCEVVASTQKPVLSYTLWTSLVAGISFVVGMCLEDHVWT